MKILFATAALTVAALAASAPAWANDEQALRQRNAVADPIVPLPWDRRDNPETWRYRDQAPSGNRSCGSNSYWNGGECVRSRRR